MSLPGLLASFSDLCLFRRGPEDMPYAPRLLLAILIACGLVEVLFGLHNGVEPALLAGAVIGGLVDIGVVWMMLRGRGKRERFLQTTMALASVYLVFDLAKNLLALPLPVKAWRHAFLSHPGHLPVLTGDQTLLVFAVTVLGIWQLCVWISTLRRSLEIPRVGSVLVFLGLFFANMLVTMVIASFAGVA